MAKQTGSIDLKASKNLGDIATDTAQYFWFTSGGSDNGAHITEIDKTTFQNTPSGGNVLATSNGIAVRDGLTELATFGATGAQIGQTSDTHIEMDADSFIMVDSHGSEFAHIGSPIGTQITDTFVYTDSKSFTLSQTPSSTVVVTINEVETSSFSVSGTTLTLTATLTENDVITAQYETAAEIKYYTMGVRSGDAGDWSMAEGYNTTASGNYSHAEGESTTANGTYAHAEGYNSTASGEYSHAEGSNSTAIGNYSHTEGTRTITYGYCAHAEGALTTANGTYAHAEGYRSIASGEYSHAEGSNSTARWSYSHAQNQYTIAAKRAQTAIGTYNEEDTSATTIHPSGTSYYGQYSLIIGNGTADNARSNALTVDWAGNVDIASGASYKIGGTAIADYIVEQGTSGNWTYRKWNSGKLEQWYTGNPSSYTCDTARGGLYSGGWITYTYPVAFVGNYPTISTGVTLASDYYVVTTQTRDASLTEVKVRIISSGSIASNSGYNITIYAHGTWQ